LLKAGFGNVKIQKEKRITIPNDILSLYLNASELENYNSGESGIYSITVYADKVAK